MPAHDIDVRALVWSGVAIVAAIVAAIGAVLLLLHLWHVAPGADRVGMPYDLVIEGPALQSAPQPELADERVRKARILTTSAWVDEAHGVVRLPIATAMRLLVERSGEHAGASAANDSSPSSGGPVAASSAPAPGTASSPAGATR